MRLLRRCDTGDFSLTQFSDEAIPPYAILSHTWGADTEEVTFEDLANGTGNEKPGYVKIQFCGEQARLDALEYFWIDTCCINKANKAEVSKAINAMFFWYRNATRCYVYLLDVSEPPISINDECGLWPWESDFRNSRWFTRGWTLQELLAPYSVEFFSQQGKRLGDKGSLRQQIHEITNISHRALQGDPLSQFSVDERLQWIEHRQTTREEDKAYSLLGIFNVYILPIYGEGEASAFARLMDKFHKMQKYIQDLHLTDPSYDKKRIEDTKGGLLKDSYIWITTNSDFQQWRDSQNSQLLWIKGDPGKGKTMLLCGIINELKQSVVKTTLLSYFFCQATDSRINNATAVLRGLIYMLVNQQPSLVSHIEKHSQASKTVFEDANAWIALSEIFTSILQDPNLNGAYFIIDGLDECVADLPKLLDFIVRNSSISSHFKWIVSSRNWPDIEERLEKAGHKVRLCLELNAESVSTAVSTYIQHKVNYLSQQNDYSPEIRQQVLDHLFLHANDTFLWVALVCQDLENVRKRNIKKKLAAYPPGLDPLYEKMAEKTWSSDDADYCKRVLATITLVYEPITLKELTSLIEMPDISIGTGAIYFVHQSAKDFLFEKASEEIFPSGEGEVHYQILSNSLKVMSRTLQRDIYKLDALGYPIWEVRQPDPDPLRESRYSCIYWVDHLCDWNPNRHADYAVDLQDGGAVHEFVRRQYLYWLEALSLCKITPKGIVSIEKLEALIQGKENARALIELVRDAHRFILSHKWAIQNNPLQAYASALVFSPTCSLVGDLFKEEKPDWLTIRHILDDRWSPCLQTLEGHSGIIWSVALSHDSTRLASGSGDHTVKIWDASSGECLQTLEGHFFSVCSVAFSHDSTQLASGSADRIIKIWDARGECLQTLMGHGAAVWSVAFSHDSTRLVSGSYDNTIKIWDLNKGECLQTLIGHGEFVFSVAFSHDSTRLASGSNDGTVKIWDANSGECLQTLKDHSVKVWSVAFSRNSTKLASGSGDNTVKIWDASSGECLQTLIGHGAAVCSVAFSHDSTWLASGSDDKTVKIWDTNSGKCLQTLKGHSLCVWSVAFSHVVPTQLVSGSDDDLVKIWDISGSDESLQALDSHGSYVCSVAFSHDSAWLASGSDDNTVKIWDTDSGKCLQTLKGHIEMVWSVAFSHHSIQLASGSGDTTIKIWDASSGKCLQTLMGHDFDVSSVAFSHDSTKLASGSKDYTTKIWDLSSGKCLQTLKHRNFVSSVAFSHDSTWLAAGSGDSTVKIWDLSNGECLQTFKEPIWEVNSVAFSHDSTRLVTGSDSATVRIFDTNSGKCLHTIEGHSLYVSSIFLSDNFMQLVSDSSDNRIDQGLGLSKDCTWITYNSENIIWLPSEHRPTCMTNSGDMIGVGTATGRVWICRVERNKRAIS